MVRRPLTIKATDASWQQRLEESVDCGNGLIICGELAVVDQRPVAIFTFNKSYSRDLGSAMQHLGAKIIGVMPNGVRTNPHNPRQIILVLRPGTKVQKLAAALGFKDKVVEWVMTNPDGSDIERKRQQSNRDTRRRQHAAVAPPPFKNA
jgi:hypothetical protein